MRNVFRVFLFVALAAASLSAPRAAQAGCGCEKPPPPPASVRPAATWPGREVTLFHPALEEGETYDVLFESGTTSAALSVPAQAVLRRDLADGSEVPQLVLPLPELPLGPTRIEVREGGGSLLVALDDDAFTVAPPPLQISTEVARYEFRNARAAVGRDGTVYLSLDFSDIQQARIFRAQALGYPLRFEHMDLAFWNVQGFLMQLLDRGMPGLFSLDAGSSTDSDVLQYSRHEFHTHLLAHSERAAHALDPVDPNWHLDGTPHIDHDHQLLAIAGKLADGSLPIPGATPPFQLVVETFTLFHHGLVADDRVEVKGSAAIDSYHSGTGLPGAAGDVRSNGSVLVESGAVVSGDVTASDVEIHGTVTGTVNGDAEPEPLLPVDVPDTTIPLGKLELDGDDVRVLGPGSYRATELRVKDDAQLVIANDAGPVTLYVTERIEIIATDGLVTAVPDPERFAVYMAGDSDVRVLNEGSFHGVLYAPSADVEVTGNGEFFGAFVGNRVKVDDSSQVHYDEALRGTPEDDATSEVAQLRVKKARHGKRSGRLLVVAKSDADGSIPLTVSIDGVADEAPMEWKARSRRWVYKGESDLDLESALVFVRGADGSVASAAIH